MRLNEESWRKETLAPPHGGGRRSHNFLENGMWKDECCLWQPAEGAQVRSSELRHGQMKGSQPQEQINERDEVITSITDEIKPHTEKNFIVSSQLSLRQSEPYQSVNGRSALGERFKRELFQTRDNWKDREADREAVALLKVSQWSRWCAQAFNSTKHPSSGALLSNVNCSLDSNSSLQNSPSGVICVLCFYSQVLALKRGEEQGNSASGAKSQNKAERWKMLLPCVQLELSGRRREKKKKGGSWYWPGRKKGCHSDTRAEEAAAQQRTLSRYPTPDLIVSYLITQNFFTHFLLYPPMTFHLDVLALPHLISLNIF